MGEDKPPCCKDTEKRKYLEEQAGGKVISKFKVTSRGQEISYRFHRWQVTLKFKVTSKGHRINSATEIGRIKVQGHQQRRTNISSNRNRSCQSSRPLAEADEYLKGLGDDDIRSCQSSLVEATPAQVVRDDDICDGVEYELDVVCVCRASLVTVDLLCRASILRLKLGLDESGRLFVS